MRWRRIRSALRATALRERLRQSLWLPPVVAMAGASIAGRALIAVDRRIPQEATRWYLFGGNPDSAREVLSTIASAMMSFTAVVFSISIVALQLASSQFSPRVLQTFLSDRVTRMSMGAFIGSFVFAMVVMPEVRSPEDDGGGGFVPALSVFVALIGVLVAVVVFVRYIHHMAHSIRAVHVIRRIGDSGRRTLDAFCARDEEAPVRSSSPGSPRGAPRLFQHDRSPGVIVSVSEKALVELAVRHDARIEVLPKVGDFVPRRAPLFRVWGGDPLTLDHLREHVAFGSERSPLQDPTFAFRQLVDIAERALSPGVNDPTTATQVLDQLHDLVRGVADRPLPGPEVAGPDGAVRLVVPRPSWEDLVALAFDEIHQYGSDSAQVAGRMRRALEDLLEVAPGDRRAPLVTRLRSLVSAGRA